MVLILHLVLTSKHKSEIICSVLQESTFTNIINLEKLFKWEHHQARS